MRELLLAHRYLYYVLGMPVLSDYDYDLLEREYEGDLGVGSSLASSYTQEVIDVAESLLQRRKVYR